MYIIVLFDCSLILINLQDMEIRYLYYTIESVDGVLNNRTWEDLIAE